LFIVKDTRFVAERERERRRRRRRRRLRKVGEERFVGLSAQLWRGACMAPLSL